MIIVVTETRKYKIDTDEYDWEENEEPTRSQLMELLQDIADGAEDRPDPEEADQPDDDLTITYVVEGTANFTAE